MREINRKELAEKIDILYLAFTRKTLISMLSISERPTIHALDKYKSQKNKPSYRTLSNLAKVINIDVNDFYVDNFTFINSLSKKNKINKDIKNKIIEKYVKSAFLEGAIRFDSILQNDYSISDEWTQRLLGDYFIYHYNFYGNTEIVRAHMLISYAGKHYLSAECKWHLRGREHTYKGIIFELGDKLYFFLEETGLQEIVNIITNCPKKHSNNNTLYFHGIISAADDSNSSYRSVPSCSKVLITKIGENEGLNDISEKLGVYKKEEIDQEIKELQRSTVCTKYGNNRGSYPICPNHNCCVIDVMQHLSSTTKDHNILRSDRPNDLY